ncbi:MAG: YhcH/YjgK/YiaL family protein [Clostridium sp.]|nr:YhcH/YjgK/YiaL family protein [Clostridium sp.]
MMKRFAFAVIAGLAVGAASQAQVYTRQCDDDELVEKASKWMESGEWRNGFAGALPHESVNAVDFYEQYQKNPEQWKALFGWLATTDLTSIPAGRHPIEGSTLVASVEDSENVPFGVYGSESHRQKIDFQYAVAGTERFGIIDHETSTPNCEYRPDVIHYDYDPEKVKFYDSTPDRFFLFFPEDWHIAKIANDASDQKIRVIVVKVDYKE